jgi:hypothetical protein
VTQEESLSSLSCDPRLISAIEIVEDIDGQIKIDVLECPREISHFFHRRMCCDCLKEQYYHLLVEAK